jgi:large subunit ribosomal protein L20
MANHRHKKIIKMAKGYRGRTNCFRIAVQRVEKALQYAYRDRRVRPCHV